MKKPCDDVVSRGVFEQVKWERDIAIEQLHELGYELGQKIEPCNDSVSREAVDEMIKAEMPERGMWEIWGDKEKEIVCEVCVDLFQKLSELPSVRPQEQTGHWLYSGENGADRWTCDNCFDFVKKPTKVCPNCGARMGVNE